MGWKHKSKSMDDESDSRDGMEYKHGRESNDEEIGSSTSGIANEVDFHDNVQTKTNYLKRLPRASGWDRECSPTQTTVT